MNKAFQPQPSSLPREYVSGGEVTKRMVYRSDDTEVAVLSIPPQTEILLHTHTDDGEIYFLIDDGRGELCKLGDSHSFSNQTADTVRLLSVKSTKKLEVVKADTGEYVQGY